MRWRHKLFNDRWAIENVFRGLRGGFFIEAGAIDGIRASASYVLEKEFSWNGICVEPIDESYRSLVINRSCRTDNRALYSESGLDADFMQLHKFPGRSGIIQHLRSDTIARAEDSGSHSSVKRTVSLLDLLNEHKAPQTIHYICLDVEGAEEPILRGFPFDDPYRILAISTEGDQCAPLLKSKGYSEVSNPHTDRIHEHYYLHPSIASNYGA
jgi:FkbM family methyltransferase